MEASQLPQVNVPSPQIGRHELICLLGQGGMARVYLAFQRGAFDAAKIVVVKQLRPEFAEDQEFVAMFVDEARLVMRFNHPNVVHTYEVLAEPTGYYLVMEYLEGQTLSQFLRRVTREGFPLDEQVWILSQVLAGLAYAHELKDFDGTPLGIVHRDVSPSNVFVTSAGEVKLLDFGIAKAAGAVSFTRQGVVKGKIGYVAPEQCRGQPSDARSDLFSVGVMLWEAIAQRRRANTETELAMLLARLDDTEPAIEEVVPGVAPALAAACKKALAYDSNQRFASAAEFQAALEAYLATRPQRNLQESVGRLLRRHFAPDMAAVREAIEAHAASSVRTSTSMPIEPGTLTSSSSSLLMRKPGQASTSQPSISRSSISQPSISYVDVAPQQRSRLVFAGAGLAAFAIAAFLLSRGSAPQTAPAPTVASAARLGSGAPPSATPATANPAQKAPLVRLTISASPAGARLRLDGERVENPYRSEVTADDREHELLVTADGYEPEMRRLRFDRDLDLRLALSKEAVDRTRGARVSAPRTIERRAPVASVAPAAGERLVAPAPSTVEEVKPGTDLKKRASAPPTRTIDEQDPYSK
jgi:serine/threonine-protein kinase